MSNRITSLPIRMSRKQCRFSKSSPCSTISSTGWAKTNNSRWSNNSSNSNSRCNSNTFNTPIMVRIHNLSIRKTLCSMWSLMEVILECPKILSMQTVQNQQQARIRMKKHSTIIRERKLPISPPRIIDSNRITQSIKCRRLRLRIWPSLNRTSHTAQ